MSDQNLPPVIQQAAREQRIQIPNVNLMLPTQTFGDILGKYDKVSIELVSVDADSKDVFSLKKGEYTLGKRPLMAISNALGLLWDPKNTGIIERTEMYSRAKATAVMRKPNGEFIPFTDEKTVDVSVFEREQRLEAKKGKRYWNEHKGGRGGWDYKPWENDEERDCEIEKAIIQALKFKDEKAMTGAMERVIRKIIAIKDVYTKDELSKPLAFPRITLDASKMLDDPNLRQAAIDKMTGSTKSIFGGQDEPKAPEPLALTNGNTLQAEAEIVDEGTGEEADLFGNPIPPEPEVDPWQEEYEALRKWIKDVCPQLSPSNQGGLRAWMATKAYENMDELRAMKAKIEGAIAGKKGAA